MDVKYQESNVNKTHKLAIIGGGPRALTLLERLVSFGIVYRDIAIDITVFEPNRLGQGCHSIHQKEHLLVNTVASQITMFSDTSVMESGPNSLRGPTFYEWLISKNNREYPSLTWDENGYYSRRLLGEYLCWVATYLIESSPSNIHIRHVDCIVQDVQYLCNGWKLFAGNIYRFDSLVLATGHEEFHDRTKDTPLVINNPYPINEKMSDIVAADTVAIVGMGLTMCDIVSELTVGRGGIFIRNSNGELEYRPSGEEPKIVAFSRSGVPLNGRAKNEKGVSGVHIPRFLTLDRMLNIRNFGKVDFEFTILPILIKEMKYAYYQAYFRNNYNEITAKLFCELFSLCTLESEADLIGQYVPHDDRMCWNELQSPIPNYALDTQTNFTAWFRAFIKSDIEESRRGNLSSPIKAACDVIRDVRDNLRSIVDLGALSEDSHRWFCSTFVPIMNRLAVGPPKERTEEMLALMDADILTVDLGPNVRYTITDNKFVSLSSPRLHTDITATKLIKGRLNMPDTKDSTGSLTEVMISNGVAKPFLNGDYHPGGIAVNENCQIISLSNEAHKSFWALGIPFEGPKFYTFVLPRPGINSTAIVDAGKIVKQIYKILRVDTRVKSTEQPVIIE